MLTYRYPLIAREGWLPIAITFIGAGLTHIFFGGASIPLWILVLLLILLFRDPMRKVPASPLGIVSPVDGRITAIELVGDEYLERQAICVTIKMSLFSVYSARSPIEGKINKQWIESPRRIRNVSTENADNTVTGTETYAQWIQTDESDDVVMIMEKNLLLPRPRCYAHSGERIGQGQRCGYLHFGTRVDVLIPENARMDKQVGDHVRGGADIIATLVRKSTVKQVSLD